jgi:lysophospholipase L1-like esterase
MREALTDDGDHPSIEGHRVLGERAFRLPQLDV